MKIGAIFLSLSFLLGVFNIAEKTVVLSEEAQMLQSFVEEIEQGVTQTDAQKVLDVVSRKAELNLKEDILKSMYGKRIEYRLEIDNESIEELEDEKIKFNGRFIVKGMDYQRTGEAGFVLIREKDMWKILETNFHDKLGDKNLVGVMLFLLVPVFAISFVLCVFWGWMIIDCFNNQKKNKLVWLLVLIVFQFIGAIIYYFTAKKRREKRKIKKGDGKK